MTDDVVQLQPTNHKDWILKCDCGCVSFGVHINTGYFKCTNCDYEFTDDLPGCEERPTLVREVQVSDDDHVVHQFVGEDLAFRRTVKQITSYAHDEVAALVVMSLSGKTSTWSMGYGDSADQEVWFQKRVDDLMRALK